MSAFFSRRKALKSGPQPRSSKIRVPQIVETNYISAPVEVPSDFLSAATAGPVSYTKLDWASTPLPEYADSYAVILDNVLSQSECDQLIALAETSAGAGTEGVEDGGWQPAMVNAGVGREFLSPDYRNSDRIIWDDKDMVERIWKRCLSAEGLGEELAVLKGNEKMMGWRAVEAGESWRIKGLNERMRFLRYGKGQFFREHCDGAYATEDGRQRSFYTLHLYLNDSVQLLEGKKEIEGAEADKWIDLSEAEVDGKTVEEVKDGEEGSNMLRGGATTFHSRNLERRLDVDPKAGRVLIFQHRGLLHSGDDVIEGVKYTVRTDLMYEIEQ